jgi:CheY-like chemotaxis protein
MSSVLIVDDSPIDRKIAGGLLRKIKDIQIEYAVSGEEALQKIRQHEPQVVVTDLIMPGMDGLALVAAVVSEFTLIPVNLMTGKGSEEVAVKALQEGAASYVPKGLLSDMLVETVQNLLTVAREQRQHVQLMNCIVETDWKFELGNDWNMIPHLVNYVHQGVRSVGLCDETESIRVSVALEEALNNAIFHGNLELHSELREDDPRADRWILVPEAAPLLFRTGLDGRRKAFQKAVVRLQMELESACATAAPSPQSFSSKFS